MFAVVHELHLKLLALFHVPQFLTEKQWTSDHICPRSAHTSDSATDLKVLCNAHSFLLSLVGGSFLIESTFLFKRYHHQSFQSLGFIFNNRNLRRIIFIFFLSIFVNKSCRTTKLSLGKLPSPLPPPQAQQLLFLWQCLDCFMKPVGENRQDSHLLHNQTEAGLSKWSAQGFLSKK